MKALPACLLTLSAAAVVLASPVVYALDPDHSVVHFEVLHFGTSTLRGRSWLVVVAYPHDQH
jgi:polyisoprenoid-binding protein YceI